jgi:hypothetical protein
MSSLCILLCLSFGHLHVFSLHIVIPKQLCWVHDVDFIFKMLRLLKLSSPVTILTSHFCIVAM